MDFQMSNSPTSIRKLIRYVGQNIDPTIPTIHHGSYSQNMILKTVKTKLESLEAYCGSFEERTRNLD
jgi:hypothetical protein